MFKRFAPKFATENKLNLKSIAMKGRKRTTSYEQDNKQLHYCDERLELLDSIKEMVEQEIDKRIGSIKVQTDDHNSHPEKPPPTTHARDKPLKGFRKLLQSLFHLTI